MRRQATQPVWCLRLLNRDFGGLLAAEIRRRITNVLSSRTKYIL